MGLQDPGTLTVECDNCGESEEFDTTTYADNTFGVDDATVEAKGWYVNHEEYLCPDCVKTEALGEEPDEEDKDQEEDEEEDEDEGEDD